MQVIGHDIEKAAETGAALRLAGKRAGDHKRCGMSSPSRRRSSRVTLDETPLSTAEGRSVRKASRTSASTLRSRAVALTGCPLVAP